VTFLLFGLAATWAWRSLLVAPYEFPPPAFPRTWVEAQGSSAESGSPPAAANIAGEWAAWEVHGRPLNECRVRFQVDANGVVRVLAEAEQSNGWRSWGRGLLNGRTVRFDWTGPHGWSGESVLEFDPDTETFEGWFRRRAQPNSQPVAGRRVQRD